jgi:hypothetical protein
MNEQQVDFSPKPESEDAVEIMLHRALDSFKRGEMIMTEVQLKQALKQADMIYGHNSESVHYVLSIMAEFYRAVNREADMVAVEKRMQMIAAAVVAASGGTVVSRPGDASQLQDSLIGRRRTGERPVYERKVTAAQVPQEVRRSCQILGLDLSDITAPSVHQAWKTAMAKDVHPDLGGEQEIAIMVNTARDVLVKWLEGQQPNLAKRFQHMVSHQI